MTFNAEQLRVLEESRPIWEGFLQTQTMNTGDVRVANIRSVYDETLGLSGHNPSWSYGCFDCLTNCIRKIYAAYDEQIANTPAPKPEKVEKPKPEPKTGATSYKQKMKDKVAASKRNAEKSKATPKKGTPRDENPPPPPDEGGTSTRSK